MSGARGPAKIMLLMPWGRVGSNLLVMMLRDSLPRGTVKIGNEPFTRIKNADRQSEWLDRHFGIASSKLRLIGCKSSIRAMAIADLLARDMERLGLSLIRHRRRNLVKVAVSVLRGRLYAAHTMRKHGEQKWGVRPGNRPLPPTALDPEAFVQVTAHKLGLGGYDAMFET